ncbi:MAG: DUF481 domain-containing protein [Chloroherpetonaceae bacterium]|nr:DUF481 domain-containing protein [Chloroherpetonaceae bacterium]
MLFSHAGSGIYAQVNTEALFRSSSSPFSLRAELSFGFNAGNSELFRWQASLRADYHTALFSTFVVGDIAQASADNQILLYRGFVHGRFIWHLNTTFHPEFFVQREFNEFILLKGRSLFGSGMRLMLLHLQPIDSVMSIRLTLGIGAMWENEIFAADNPETKLLRSTNYLSILWRLNARTSVQLIGYFQVDTRHWDDHRILIEGNLAVGITDKLILSIILNYRYDNEPVPTVRPFDIELRNALTLSF